MSARLTSHHVWEVGEYAERVLAVLKKLVSTAAELHCPAIGGLTVVLLRRLSYVRYGQISAATALPVRMSAQGRVPPIVAWQS